MNLLFTQLERIFFTGHSLGGALASLASFRVVLDRYTTPERVVLYTFGQPRVGDPIFTKTHERHVPNRYISLISQYENF